MRKIRTSALKHRFHLIFIDRAVIMHFGEYLVQQKILSAHQILKALAEQRKRRKFLPLLLVELNALPDYRALRYCTEADQNGEDFLEVLLREGFVSKEQFEQIRNTWTRSGPQLGDLLVQMGLINEETRDAALEEFEAEKELERNLAQIG